MLDHFLINRTSAGGSLTGAAEMLDKNFLNVGMRAGSTDEALAVAPAER